MLHVSISSDSSSGELQEKQSKYLNCVILIWIHILQYAIIIVANTPLENVK
jgi:hypothetical protein